MKHTIDHSLDKALSKKVIEKAMDAYKVEWAEYTPRFDWKTDDSGEFGFVVKGFKLGGTIRVREKQIDVDMDVPLIARPFQGRAMKVIDNHVRQWVEKAKKGEI